MDDIRASGSCVSSTQRIRLGPAVQLGEASLGILSASQIHEKDVRFTSLSNSRCIFKMTLGPVSYFLTESLFLRHPRTPRSITDRDAPA